MVATLPAGGDGLELPSVCAWNRGMLGAPKAAAQVMLKGFGMSASSRSTVVPSFRCICRAISSSIRIACEQTVMQTRTQHDSQPTCVVNSSIIPPSVSRKRLDLKGLKRQAKAEELASVT